MIDTEKIKADIELAREPVLPTQSMVEQSLIYNARSACARHAEDLLEERDHLLHPSQGEVVTYQSRIDELAAALKRVSEERDRFRGHSETLNRLLWRIAEELGQAVDGGEVDPDALVDQLINRLQRVEGLVEADWPMPPEAAGSFYLPTSMFDSAQRRELRRALGDPES